MFAINNGSENQNTFEQTVLTWKTIDQKYIIRDDNVSIDDTDETQSRQTIYEKCDNNSESDTEPRAAPVRAVAKKRTKRVENSPTTRPRGPPSLVARPYMRRVKRIKKVTARKTTYPVQKMLMGPKGYKLVYMDIDGKPHEGCESLACNCKRGEKLT